MCGQRVEDDGPRVRTIGIGRASPFVDNTSVTSKYTAISFVPLALFGQFRRFPNLYFLLIGLLMMYGRCAARSTTRALLLDRCLGVEKREVRRSRKSVFARLFCSK